MSDIKSKEYIKPIREEFDLFYEYFNKAMRSKVALVDLVVRFILKQKSKKLRPVLVLLSAKTCGEVTERTYRAAGLVELLHTATLIHDDVVDNADTRRGFPSINSIWKNKVAVLMGDYLLSKGLQIAVDNDDFDYLKVITSTVKRMSEGELLQISRTKRLNNDFDTYYKIISDKTASLLATCTYLGSLSVTENKETAEDFMKFGENLGMAFQITDDILDFSGNTSILGKAIGNDIKEKKLTLPLLAAFSVASEREVKEIKKIINKDISRSDYQKIVKFVEERNGVGFAKNKAKEFIEKGKEIIYKYPDSESKRALLNLSDFILERNS